MKKLIFMGACLVTIFAVHGVHAQRGYHQYRGGYGGGNCCQDQCCQPKCCEEATGECYCLYRTYEPQYYCTERCVQEKCPCKKKCYRNVPEYYQVQRCRMVPEYYTETKCRQRCECYEVDDCKYRTRTIREPKCRYIPRYYWKHECLKPCCDPCQNNQCPAPPHHDD